MGLGYDQLKDKPKLMKQTISLHGSNGRSLRIDGRTDLAFSVCGTEMKQFPYVA